MIREFSSYTVDPLTDAAFSTLTAEPGAGGLKLLP